MRWFALSSGKIESVGTSLSFEILGVSDISLIRKGSRRRSFSTNVV